MEKFVSKYLKGDYVIWFILFALCVFSIVEMFSASSSLVRSGKYMAPVMEHTAFLIVGIVLTFGAHLLPTLYVRLLAYPLLALSIVLLILTPFIGPLINGAHRWIVILGIQFQPSELAKLSLIIVSADLLSRIKNRETDEKKYFWWLMGLTGIVCALILVGGNLSTAIFLAFVVLVMCFISKTSWKRIFTVVAAVVAIAALTFVMPAKYLPSRYGVWANRLHTFFETPDTVRAKSDAPKYLIYDVREKDESQRKKNAQSIYGKIAIARGAKYGLFPGFGVFPGNSEMRNSLPQAYNDSIFAIIVEETGLIGALIVISLYLALLFRAGQITMKSPQVFPALLVIGLVLVIVVQAFISMGVVAGLGPVTGLPLPLISSGGTSIVVTCLYFGIILGITNELKQPQQTDSNPVEQTPETPMPIVELDEL